MTGKKDWQIPLTGCRKTVICMNHYLIFLFVDDKNKSRFISEWKGKNLVVGFWASWCGDCSRQMTQMSQYEKLAEKYGEVTFLYINKTDGSRETIETLRNILTRFPWRESCIMILLWMLMTCWDCIIFPQLFLSIRKEKITAWSSSQIEKASIFEALLKNAVAGGSKTTAEFIINYMMDGDGGIHSAYVPGSQVNINSEVLSESQGLGLLYAVSVQDKDLFDKIFRIYQSVFVEGRTGSMENGGWKGWQCQCIDR